MLSLSSLSIRVQKISLSCLNRHAVSLTCYIAPPPQGLLRGINVAARIRTRDLPVQPDASDLATDQNPTCVYYINIWSPRVCQSRGLSGVCFCPHRCQIKSFIFTLFSMGWHLGSGGHESTVKTHKNGESNFHLKGGSRQGPTKQSPGHSC